jgi:phage baseplate assembly protein W
MPTRRLDDRIRQLCAEIAKTPAGSGPLSPEMEATLQELLGAIHEKTERLRTLAARKLLRTKDHIEGPGKERREAS